MNKKILYLVLCVLMMALTGCGSADRKTADKAAQASGSAALETEAASDASADSAAQKTESEQFPTDIQNVSEEDVSAGQAAGEKSMQTDISGNSAIKAEVSGNNLLSDADGTEASGETESAAEKAEALLPAVVHLTDKIRDYKSESGTELLTTDYQDPEVTIRGNDNATEAIRNAFQELKYGFAEKSGEYKAQAERENQENGPLSAAYYLNQSYALQRCDNALISFQIITGDYTGGAHGMYGGSGITFDTATGKKLTLDDVSDDQSAFLNSCKEEILAQCAALPKNTLLVSSTQDLNNRVDKLLAGDSWFFTKAGLKFVAGPYELAAYSVGSIPFTIPYDKMPGLKKEYQYTGNPELEARDGSTLTADLNGDGKPDTVTYDLEYDVNKDQSKAVFQVNGTDETPVLAKNKISLMGNASGVFYLMDLDTKDNTMEIAIPDSGESGDSATYLFRYDGKKVSFLGSVPDMPGNSSFMTFGDGTILAGTKLSLLETAYTEALYRISDKGKIEKDQDEWYTIQQYSGEEGRQHAHDILKNVTVYQENDLKSEQVVLTPADGPVLFPKTDDRHWVKVVTADGRNLNMYLNDFDTIKSGRKEQAVTDTFSNIFLAD